LQDTAERDFIIVPRSRAAPRTRSYHRSKRVKSEEDENPWTLGDGWKEEDEGSLDVRQAVDVYVSRSGKMDDEEWADVRHGLDVPLTWSDLMYYLESDAFDLYRNAKAIRFTNEGEDPTCKP